MPQGTTFRYASLPRDLREMNAELESLGGGGEARVGHAAVYCAVCPAPLRAAALQPAPADNNNNNNDFYHNHHDQRRRHHSHPRPVVTVSPDASSVVVSDPNATPDAALASAPRKYRVASATDSGTAPEGVTRDAAEWLMSGYDATVVAFGQSAGRESHIHSCTHPLVHSFAYFVVLCCVVYSLDVRGRALH